MKLDAESLLDLNLIYVLLELEGNSAVLLMFDSDLCLKESKETAPKCIDLSIKSEAAEPW